MDNKKDMKSPLIHEFRPGDDKIDIKTKYVYHYTSPEAFLSIVQTKSIRFSDIRYMNDRSESVFFVKRLIEFVDNNSSGYPLFCEAVNFLLKENDYSRIKDLSIDQVKFTDIPHLPTVKQRKFIFCTSKDPDSLNMWNYYASGGKYTGYNFGLSVQDFLRSFDIESENQINSFIVYYGDVIYKKKQQFEAIAELADKIEKPIPYDGTVQAIHRRALLIRNYIELKGPFYKDYSFSSENEFRFLLSIADKRIPHNESDASKFFGQYNKQICEDFYVRNGIIVPFLKVAIPPMSIKRITVSPITEFEIAKSSIKEILDINGIRLEKDNEVPVFKSKIPIRF